MSAKANSEKGGKLFRVHSEGNRCLFVVFTNRGQWRAEKEEREE